MTRIDYCLDAATFRYSEKALRSTLIGPLCAALKPKGPDSMGDDSATVMNVPAFNSLATTPREIKQSASERHTNLRPTGSALRERQTGLFKTLPLHRTAKQLGSCNR